MAATSPTASSSCELPSHQLVLKNTFFTLVDEDCFLSGESPAARRTNSAPPPGRLRSKSDGVVGRSLPSLKLTSTRWSDQSSDEGGDSGDEGPTRKTSAGSTSEDGDGDAYPSSNSQTGSSDDYESSNECEDMVPLQSGGRFALSLESLVAEPVPVPRARLRSNAKAFKTSQVTKIALQLPEQVLQVPNDVKREFADVVAAGQMAMKQCKCDVVAEQHDTKDEWTVALKVSVKTLRDQQEVLARAKASLLEAAENSENTYIVGYETDPFVVTAGGTGFVTRLARVTDESCACWDFLTQGFCIRGASSCRWQHPVWQAVVCVTCDTGK